MTEQEWLVCEIPRAMLEFQRGSDRKLQLFALACCRDGRFIHWNRLNLLDFRSLDALTAFERFVDGLASPEELATAVSEAWDAANTSDPDGGVIDDFIERDQVHRRIAELTEMGRIPSTVHDGTLETTFGIVDSSIDVILFGKKRASLLRDIFGNPFRPLALDPRWRTSTVVDLARTIYDEFPRQAGGYMRMPILADALMDAGCDSDEIIQHCRGPGPHVRGCWVVDLILGKE